MATKKNSIITSTMQKTREAKKTEENKLTPEQEAFVNGGDSDLIVNKEEQPKPIPAKRGRKPSLVKKQKMTFELAEDLVNELNEVVKSMGMTRASFMAQAVMKAVKDAQNN